MIFLTDSPNRFRFYRISSFTPILLGSFETLRLLRWWLHQGRFRPPSRGGAEAWQAPRDGGCNQWWPGMSRKHAFCLERLPFKNLVFIWTYMPLCLPYILIKQSQFHCSQRERLVCLYVLNDMMSYCDLSWASGKWKVLVRDSELSK